MNGTNASAPTPPSSTAMPRRRPRRLRQSPTVRDMVQETRIRASDLIAPLFVHPGSHPEEKVASLPGVVRFSVDALAEHCVGLRRLGIGAVALFPATPPASKNPTGTEALNPENLVCRAVRAVKRAVPDLVVITDVALDPYTDHGHDGVLDPRTGDVDNDATVALLSEMAVVQARAGSDWVAPSDMMDGRVGAIRVALDAAGMARTVILAYSAKFASAF
ncbi:MAG: porphobilinogen synthase, partial [Verrucomicrobiales bacterium]|nr:porphobilinogen synthase [Verrucomicrobiales bacterium]